MNALCPYGTKGRNCQLSYYTDGSLTPSPRRSKSKLSILIDRLTIALFIQIVAFISSTLRKLNNMSTKQSTNVAAVLQTAKAQVTITTRPIPQPGPNQVLVRNHAVAANPCDWKVQAYGIFVPKVRIDIAFTHNFLSCFPSLFLSLFIIPDLESAQ
jgi:hypothetical protein